METPGEGDQQTAADGEHHEAVPQRPATGNARVDVALSELDSLAETPVSEHPAVFERIHGELVEVLGELHPGSGGDAGRAAD